MKWQARPASERADILRKAADALERNRAEFTALLISEAGKTLPDAIDEIREAVDFCRYYAAKGEVLFDERGLSLPGPTGETNIFTMQGRGVFVCISPWNFPLAIFTGQIVAALMAGNAVIAKPAGQTPLVATRMIQLLLKAGIPKDVLSLITGEGREIGAAMAQHPDAAGIVFTGSTGTAKAIQRMLAEKDGPIVPFIAETGGQNAMIVDSSALPEQVVDDVIRSAFGSAGQRCSALRVLYLQEDIADTVITMLSGAMKELKVGYSGYLKTDTGPIIDEGALNALKKHQDRLQGFGKKLAEAKLDEIVAETGNFLAPSVYEINSIRNLEQENFGPILHVVRYKSSEIDDVLDDILATGYGLTFGIHSRIENFHDKITARFPAGNIYINRNMIGAVVGTQPFGGHGLSGTGPKAGGPNYLRAFAQETVVTTDTTAAGGNASLVSLAE